MENDIIKNKYKILKKLGQGSFGSVYKVLNEENKEYVMKEIVLTDETEEEMGVIENEGKLLSKINSEYVVKYCDSFIENSKYYLVMELCEGDSLDNFINEYKSKNVLIPGKIIIDIFKQLLLGLKIIHEQNIIHRDLKPANIFLSKDKKVKIIDFGMSKETSKNKIYAQTIAGTISYMSPEILQGQKYTNKTDIWSAGCILYELCTLNYIFPPSNHFSFINSIVKDKPKNIDKIYGEELQDLIDLLLEKDPIKRPNIDFAISELNKCEIKYNDKIDNVNDILESALNPEQEMNNIEIEENLQLEIMAHLIFSVKKESHIKKVLTTIGAGALGFAIACIPILDVIAAVGVGVSAGVGAGVTGGVIQHKMIEKKEEFINENINIINEIFISLLKILKKKVEFKKIEKESIIALSNFKFIEKIIVIKEKFRQKIYINKLKKKLDNSLNILLLGNANTGKTTLINSFLKLSDENKTKDGEEISTDTIDFITYKNEVNGNYYVLHDTNRMTNKYDHYIAKKMERVQEEINERIKSGKANKLIHCIWYCITGNNIQDSDKKLIKILNNIYTTKQIPIIFIHTKTTSKLENI